MVARISSYRATSNGQIDSSSSSILVSSCKNREKKAESDRIQAGGCKRLYIGGREATGYSAGSCPSRPEGMSKQGLVAATRTRICLFIWVAKVPPKNSGEARERCSTHVRNNHPDHVAQSRVDKHGRERGASITASATRTRTWQREDE